MANEANEGPTSFSLRISHHGRASSGVGAAWTRVSSLASSRARLILSCEDELFMEVARDRKLRSSACLQACQPSSAGAGMFVAAGGGQNLSCNNDRPSCLKTSKVSA